MHFVNDGLSSFLPGVLPYLAAHRGVPLAWAGALMTALLIAQTAQPFAGLWADRLGGRRLVVWGPVLAAGATVALALLPSAAALVAALFLIGVGSTLFHPQAIAAARAVAAERAGTLMSVFLVGGELGRAVAPLAAGLVAVGLGVGRLWLLAVPLALTWPWVWRRVPSLPPRPRRAARLDLRGQRGRVAALVAYATLRALAIYGISTLVPLYWYERGGSLVTGAAFVTILIGIGIVGNLTGGLVADRWGRRPVLAGSAAATAALFTVFFHSHGVWLWPLLALTGVALFSTLPVTILVGQDAFPADPAFGSGVALGLANGLGAALNLPLTLLAGRWGVTAGFWAVVAALLACLPLVGPMRADLRPQPALGRTA
jgi:FSR family fosmidomycin resistance protein-like MFS transporter